MPALFSQTEMGKEGIRHLGYPAYFGLMVLVFKIAGALSLIIPKIPARVKEWAYAGLFFDLVGATYSGIATDGFLPPMLFMLLPLTFLFLSYFLYHKKNANSIK